MNTIVYIDGGNLYHGLLRFHPELKWLDLEKFAKALVRSDHQISAVKYFTSRIKTHPYDPKPIERQNVYLQTLVASSSVSIIEGYYQNSKKCQLPDMVTVGNKTFSRPNEWRASQPS